MPSSLYAYGLERSSSAALLRANTSYSYIPTLPRIARSYSCRDVTGYFRPYDRHRPLWLSEPYTRPLRLRSPAPVRFERNKQMAELYWRDRYYFFSPLYKRANVCRRPFQSEYGSHVYTYWTRYNGYSYDRTHPRFYRRYFNPIEDYFG